MGHLGVGSYTEQYGYRGPPSLSAHSTTWQLLGITEGVRIQLHTHLSVSKQDLGFFIIYQKGDYMVFPIKIHFLCSQIYSRVSGGRSGHYSIEYHKKCTCMMLSWINYTNKDHIVDFLTLIYGQMTSESYPDNYTDL